MDWQPTHPAMRALLKTFVQESSPTYVVGGLVRDQLLGRESDQADLDLVVPHSAMAISKQVADRVGWAYYPLDEARDVGRLVLTINTGEPLVCDVARMRGESIEADLLARDFTVNAMAVEFSRNNPPQLIDLVGGRADLENKLVRRVSMASLAEDPVRMLRAVRLSIQLGFALDTETRHQIERLSGTITLSSPERLRDELWKMLATDQPAEAIEEMRTMGLLRHALPEVSTTIDIEQSSPHTLDVYQHTLETVRQAHRLRTWLKGKQLPRGGVADLVIHRQQTRHDPHTLLAETLDPYLFFLRQHFLKSISAQRVRVDWLVWLALFHDVGKPTTRSIEPSEDGSIRYRFLEHDVRGAAMTSRRLELMRFSRVEIDLVDAVVRAHMRPHLLDQSFRQQAISQRARYRFFRDIGGKQFTDPPGIDTLLLALADVQALQPPTVPAHWDDYLHHVGELLYFAYADETAMNSRQKPLVDGFAVMTHTNIKPGPELGILLEQLFEAQVAGEIATQEEALALASKLIG